ncbi:hypothetical protein HCH54_005237 [Aspergillus fumigatus]
MKFEITIFITLAAAQINIYEYGTNATAAISDGCNAALSKVLDCDPYLFSLSTTDYFGPISNDTFQDQLCVDSCRTSLETYHNAVQQQCANDPPPWDGIPAVWVGDILRSTFNRSCLTDPASGNYCTNVIGEIQAALGTADTALTSISKDQLCSTCMINLIVQMQQTAYSNYNEQLVGQWVQIQDTCGTGPLPTNVQPPATNMTTFPWVDYSTPSNASCLSSNFYTVQSGENIQAIAKAQGVPTGPLRTLNGIFLDGTNLLQGQNLCLPRQCPVYLVQPGDTCNTIAEAYSLSIADLISYNPSLNRACSNLIVGDNICVGLSGQTYTPTTIAGATATKTEQYATTTTAPPGPTGYGTTKQCGSYYQATDGDTCEQISLAYSISASLFMAINPAIDEECSNLVPGLYYCVYPTVDWNATTNGTATTSTYATPPTSTPTGTTPDCYEWHTIVSGDTCSLLQTEFGITFTQLRTWNPQIDESCSNLLLDVAYCVHGEMNPQTTSATTTTPTPTPTAVAPPGPTQSGIPAICNRWVMQQDGMYCYDMAAKAGITLDLLYELNPALNGDCSGLWAGYAYCVGVSGG